MSRQNSPGFSLIELAIVMFIVSIILGGLLTPLSTRLESQNRKQTTTMLAEIKESLMGYAIINGHLPPCATHPHRAARRDVSLL